MQIYFHLATGLLLRQAAFPTTPLLPVLLVSIAPDLPMILNYSARVIRKRGRGVVRDDLCSWRWTYPVSLFTHSLFALSFIAGAIALLVPADLPWVVGAYASHLALDYFSHAKDPYPPLYPLSQWALCRRFSYYEPERHAVWVNRLMSLALASGFFLLWLR